MPYEKSIDIDFCAHDFIFHKIHYIDGVKVLCTLPNRCFCETQNLKQDEAFYAVVSYDGEPAIIYINRSVMKEMWNQVLKKNRECIDDLKIHAVVGKTIDGFYEYEFSRSYGSIGLAPQDSVQQHIDYVYDVLLSHDMKETEQYLISKRIT